MTHRLVLALRRHLRQLLPWALALAVATCSDDQGGPTPGGRAYFSFRPTYQLPQGISASQFGIVADSVRVLLTRPVAVVVLDTTVPFPADSSAIHLALPVHLQQSPETLDAVIEIRSAGIVIFVDSLQTEVKDGPPGSSTPPTIVLDYVGPGTDVALLTIQPGDTTVTLGDTLFFTATAQRSNQSTVTDFYVAWKTSDSLIARISAQGRLIAPTARGNVKVIGFTPNGVADTTDLTFVPVPVTITRDSGQGQVGAVGDSLLARLDARVKGADSLGISGIQVRFQSLTAGGAVQDTLLVTDASGRVRTRGYLGTTSGTYSYSATVVGTTITTTFTATATTAGASTIAIQSGNAQTDSAGRALATPFSVRVADAFDNPVNGAKVYWTRIIGTGTVVPDSSFTNASGIATANYTLGAVGSDSIRAALAGTSAFVTFGATAIDGAPATVSVVFGGGQTDTVGRTLTDSLIVLVRSATNQPVVGATVTWTVLRGGNTSAGTTPTSATGRAAVRYTTGTTPGTDSVQVQVGAQSTIIIAAVLTGAPSAIASLSGDAQSDTAGRTLPLPFVVHVTDAFGNDVNGALVAWNVVRGGAPSADTVATGVNGQASVSYTLGLVPGVDSVVAQVVGTGATVTFTASVEVLTASQLVLISGDAQSDTVTRVLVPMVVEAQASDTRVVDSTTIQWVIASGSGFLVAPSTLTDSTGRTSNTLTLPVAPGSTTVLAILPGLDTVVFTATATPDAPTSFTIQSGGGAQSDTIDAALGQYVVQVTDSFGNPRFGFDVVWSRIAGSGNPVLDTNVTDGGGLAFFTYILGPTAGADTVQAQLSATGATIAFTATTLPGLADSIIVLGGDLQTDTVAQLLPVNVQVRLVDRHGNVVPTTPVAFVTTLGNGAPGLDTSFTDLTGFSATGFTLGTVAGPQTVEARARGGAVVAAFTFTALPDAATVIAKTGGDLQADTANAPLPTPLAVHVTDAFGNPIDNTAIAFAVISGGGLLSADTVFTDPFGNASTTLTLGAIPGIDSVTVTVVSTSASVTFTATTLAAAPAALSYVSGDAQTDTVARTLTAPFVVRLIDAGSNGVPGVTVVFAVASGAAGPTLSNDTLVTDSLGFASTSLTLGTAAGSVTVRATSPSVTDTVVFSAFGANDLPSSIAVTGGTGQAVSVLQQVANSLFVSVTDAYGNAVDGAAVLWTVGNGSGTASPDTAFTAGGGVGVGTYLAGVSIGSDSVVATIAGTSAFVTIGIDVVAAPPVALSYVSGDSQSTAVSTPFAAPLVVLVTDSLGNPAAGALVTWQDSSGTGAGTFAPDTSVADVNGHASTSYTPLATAGPRALQAVLVAAPSTATFHGTATAGAPASIFTSAGDLQSDTVLATLATPLEVLVTDATSNPVGGAAVTWEVASGDVVFNDSSTVTDSLGHSAVTASFGTLAGSASIRAILGAGVDTATFTAVALPGTPATFLKVSGDAQTAIVSTPVALPLVVQVQDVYSNGVPGETVGMVIASGSGTLDSVQTITDSLGFAQAVTWTLGATVGTNGVQMSWSSPSASTFFQDFTATSLPIGTSKSWAGTTSTNWNDPTNWSPTGVPLASEGVFIPAATPFQPALTGPATVAAFTVQTGASVETDGFTLTASGDVRAGNTVTGLGTLEVSGVGVTVEGSVPNLLVTGTATLSAQTTVGGNLTIDGGQLDFDSLDATVGGAVTTQNGGTIKMTQSPSSITIANGATFAGGNEAGLLTAGLLYLNGGNFTVSGGASGAFDAGTGLTVVLNGATLQSISIQTPSVSRFGILSFLGTGGAQFLTDAEVQGSVLAVGGTVTGVGRTVTVGSSGVSDGGTRWFVENTIFTGSPVLADSVHSNVTLLGSTTPAFNTLITGNLTVRGAGVVFPLGGRTLNVLGDFVIDSGALLRMTVPADSLLVAGNATFAGMSTSGQLIDGVLRVGHAFIQAGDPQAFAPSGGHTTVFPIPVAYDTIVFTDTGLAASYFHHVRFIGDPPIYIIVQGGSAPVGGPQFTVPSATPYYRTITTSAAATGITEVTAGGNVFVLGSKYSVSSALPRGAGFIGINMLEIAGNVVADTTSSISATVTRITGATSTLDVNGQSIYLDGDLDIRNSGLLRMVTPGAFLTVNKNAIFGGRSTLGQLTDGTLILYGDLTQSALTNTRSFQASGNHRTGFYGNGQQLVVFGSPGGTSSRFQDVTIANSGIGVVFGSLAIVNGDVDAQYGQVSGVVGVTIAGSLSDPSSNWRPAITTFTGSPTLPDSLFGSIVFTGPHFLQAPLKVIGSVTLSGPFADLSPNGFALTITDSLVTEILGTLRMNGATDSIDVGGDAYFTGATSLTAGTLVLRGNVEQAGAAAAFDPQPGHLTVLAPSGTDTVRFANPDSTASGSGFSGLRIDADGRRIVLATPVEVRGLFQVLSSAGTDPVIEGNGNPLIVRDIEIDGVTFERTPLQIHQTSTGQTLIVLNSAFTSFLPSDTQLEVANPGTGSFQGNFNSLTFTPLTTGDTGFYVVVNNSDVVGPNFLIGIVGSNVGNGPAFSGSVNSGSASWF
ncbi:MAG: hypothetical protein ABJB33_07960 [Gemmatimonadota bacterium]